MTNLVETPNQPVADTQKQTQFDNNVSGESFYDFTMRVLKELNINQNLRHDLSKDKYGLILYSREVKQEQAISRTSEAFIKSITKNKENKLWEYFVYVPEFSDSLLSPSIEQVRLYQRIKEAQKDRNKEDYEKSDLKKIEDLFDKGNSAQMSIFMETVGSRILSGFRFYGVSSDPGKGIRQCTVLFHDKNSLQFGKMVKIGDEFTPGSNTDLQDLVREAKKGLNLDPLGALSSKADAKRQSIEKSQLLNNTV